jgi:thioredoxin 1
MPSDVGRSIISFTAPWCGGCKSLKPILGALKIPVVTYDVDVEPDRAADFHVSSLPTVLFLEDGREVKRVIGNSRNTQDEIKSFAEGR